MMFNKPVIALCIASVALLGSTVDASTEVAEAVALRNPTNDNAVYRDGDADGYNARDGYDDDDRDEINDDGNGRRLTGTRSYDRSRYVSSERYNNRYRSRYGGDGYSNRDNRYRSSYRRSYNSYDRSDRNGYNSYD